MGVLNNRITTRGLVYYHDANNIKSYTGPVCTNLITGLNGSSGSGTGYSYDTGYQNVYIPGLQQTVSSYYVDVQNNYSASGACCPNTYYFGSPSVTGNTVYTFALLVKSSKGYLNGNTMYHYEFGASGYITEFGSYSSSYQIDMGDGWYWIYNTFTSNSAATSMTLYSFYYLYATTFDRLYIAKALFMKGNFLNMHPSLWPNVNTSRSYTQSIIDLTGINTTVYANSLSYNADGSHYYGGSDYLTIPFNSNFTFNNEQTIIMWLKDSSTSTTRRNPYNQAYGGAGTITHEYDTNLNYYYGTTGDNGSTYTNHTSPFTVVVGETAMIAITRNTSQTAWYKNGVLGNTRANPYGSSVVTGTATPIIGTGYAGAFMGNIYKVQLYNVCLTAAEILQNFNAHRNLYNL